MARVVALGVLVREDCVLLVKRTASRETAPGAWDFPGGHSEDGEAPEQTLVRELAEEIGVVPTEYRELFQHGINAEGLIVYRYYVKRWSGTPSNLQEHEHSEIAWVPLAEVGKLELASPDIPKTVQAFQQ